MSQPKCSKCDDRGYVTESSQPHPEGKLVAVPFITTNHGHGLMPCDCDANLRYADDED